MTENTPHTCEHCGEPVGNYPPKAKVTHMKCSKLNIDLTRLEQRTDQIEHDLDMLRAKRIMDDRSDVLAMIGAIY